MNRLRLIVPPGLAGERLDRALAALSSLSRRRARVLIREGQVTRNGRPLRVEGRTLDEADVLEITVTGEEAKPPEARSDELGGAGPGGSLPRVVLIHRDRYLIAVDKPSGVLSQPAESRRPNDPAMDQLLLRHLAGEAGRPPFLRLVHRLDRVTSGLLLFAAHPDALKPLDRAWREGKAERHYLAVVEGQAGFERQEVDAPIARQGGGGWRFEVAGGGRPARTEVLRLARGEGYSVVRCRLLTGRTHQVRVHLAHLGLPVLGDRLYGAAPGAAPRPLLHACELRLPHPETGASLLLAAPAPDDFRPYLDFLPGHPAVE